MTKKKNDWEEPINKHWEVYHTLPTPPSHHYERKSNHLTLNVWYDRHVDHNYCMMEGWDFSVSVNRLSWTFIRPYDGKLYTNARNAMRAAERWTKKRIDEVITEMALIKADLEE